MNCPAMFRHRVTLQQQAGMEDLQGGHGTSWADVATVWASVEPMAGKESYTWGKILGESTYVIRVRYRSDVRPKMRLLYGSRIMDINSVIDEHEEHRFLALGCSERS